MANRVHKSRRIGSIEEGPFPGFLPSQDLQAGVSVASERMATFGSGSRHETMVDDWLGAPMFFSGFEEETNERLVRDAGLTILESRLEPMSEPESEPGRGPETVSFHWILVKKP